MEDPTFSHSYDDGGDRGGGPSSPPNASSAQPAPSNWHNPYLGHRLLTPSQSHLLGEYHRLSTTLRRILSTSAQLSATRPHAQVLDELRETERKMGLVITLFKASVWSIVVEQDERAEQERRQREQEEEEEAFREEEERRARGGEYADEGEEEDETARY